MADFAIGLNTRLRAAPSLQAKIGTRVYPIIRPQGSPLPAIAYYLPGGDRDEHLKGYTQTRRTRVQLRCFAEDYLTAREVAEIATDVLAEPATVGGIIFGRGKADEPRDGGGDDTSDGYVHLVNVDLLVEYRLT